MTSAQEPLALWVCPVSNLAGVARHILDVARVGLPGWRLAVAAPEGPLLEELRALGITVVPLEIGSPSHAAAELRGVLKHLRPAIAHSHLAKADILLAGASIGLPLTLVTTEHHISPDRHMFHPSRVGAWSMETVHRMRLTRFAAAIAVSASTSRDMIQRWRPRVPVSVVLNGVDRPVSPPRREPGLRLLSLSRLEREKNVQMSLQAFARLLPEHPEASFTVAGTGSLSDELQALARSLGIAKQTRFVGFVDAEQAMAQHDVLLQPSRSDNFSYALLDALSQGMGVAASPIGGNPEILPKRCIAPFDDVGRLAEIAVMQGLDVGERPSLSSSIPTVAEMADGITSVYAGTEWQNRRGARTGGERT
ncbi:glycosyltransferase family 4 protein [uncultured Microbacterium sp.]|uniref:glycosyltransferase family 4 protein n=1 Tax=uncultured Microbacterium sp. TaxID=191216 RepID=UPI0025FFB518|nr:glycosyltransferase family 4 protein [uncultured Microbacterium sp.]